MNVTIYYKGKSEPDFFEHITTYKYVGNMVEFYRKPLVGSKEYVISVPKRELLKFIWSKE